MIVICNKCGQRYEIDLSRFKDTETVVLCVSEKDADVSAESPSPPVDSSHFSSSEDADRAVHAFAETAGGDAQPSVAQSRSRRLGLRGKILLLFFLIPTLLICIAGYFSFGQLNLLSSLIRDESTSIVGGLAESIVRERGLAVARQVGLYLDNHPYLTPEMLHDDPEFMKIAVQKVGETGYTVVNWAPHDDKPWLNVAGPRPQLILKDVSKQLESRFTREDYLEFQRMRNRALKTGQMVTGYYRFVDDKEKFQVMIPIKGTAFWLVTTTYLDEFTQPITALQAKAGAIASSTQRYVLLLILFTAAFVALIAIWYGNRLSGRIRDLKDIADSISVGNMDQEIDISGRDDIGDLARAISRMKESLRLSLGRLRRRRS